jgi:hypothetical protein
MQSVGTGTENLSPTGIRFPHRPAHSDSLYRLSYPGYWSEISQVREILYKYFILLFRPLIPTHCRCTGLLLYMITFRHTTLGRTPLDEWLARRRNLLTTQHWQETSMPLGPTSEQPQTHALAHAAPGIDIVNCLQNKTFTGSNFPTGSGVPRNS